MRGTVDDICRVVEAEFCCPLGDSGFALRLVRGPIPWSDHSAARFRREFGVTQQVDVGSGITTYMGARQSLVAALRDMLTRDADAAYFAPTSYFFKSVAIPAARWEQWTVQRLHEFERMYGCELSSVRVDDQAYRIVVGAFHSSRVAIERIAKVLASM